MKAYPKIYGPYQRFTDPGPMRNKVMPGQWTFPEFRTLADTPWVWTEKVDGTNIRAHWDGHKVEFGGRTDNAQIPAKLVARLQELFPEELFEQQFGGTSVTLFGEGYGAGVQKGGGNYKSDGVDFALFDVLVHGQDNSSIWLLRDSVEEIAVQMGVDIVPRVFTGTVAEAIDAVGFAVTSSYGKVPFIAEGLIGVTEAGLLDRRGNRIMMKVKSVDFLRSPTPAQVVELNVAPLVKEASALAVHPEARAA